LDRFQYASREKKDSLRKKRRGDEYNRAGAESTGMASKETKMNIANRSLRLQVEKWLVPAPSTPVRVTQFSRTRSNQTRFVRVEVLRPAGSVGVFFFRHDDGTWCVFPPETGRLAMRAY
jgi:hypothetical protein